jgi:hypothetical protein
MGLASSPSGFSRMMDIIFRPFLDKFVVLYIDDMFIYSNNMSDHVQHLKQVLDTMRASKLFAKPSKCEFAQQELKFLGHLVGKEGVKADPDKVSNVLQRPQPLDVHELHSFLGLANYFMRFVKDCSGVAVHLTNMLSQHIAKC